MHAGGGQESAAPKISRPITWEFSALLSGDYRMVDALARVGVVRASSDNGSPCFGERHLAAAPLPMMLLSN
jgi:hypothetical protein